MKPVSPEARERQPCLPGWHEVRVPPMPIEALHASAWRNGAGVFVISTLVSAELPDGTGVGLQWHITISRNHKRPRETDVRGALRAFKMVGAEEDNHHPGIARNFWVPVDPSKRVDCQCKEDEVIITEKDGFTWTNPKEGECRGCELQRLTGRPCSLHPAETRRP